MAAPTALPDQISVHVKSLSDNSWHSFEAEMLGGERPVGPQNLVITQITPGGLDECSFDMVRHPNKQWSDLHVGNPIQVYFGGMLAFGGRIREMGYVTEDSWVVNVVCEGYHAYLNDDFTNRSYIITDQGRWDDLRNFPSSNNAGVDSTVYESTGFTNRTKKGLWVLGWPKNVEIDGKTSDRGDAQGIMIDLGPGDTRMARIEVQYNVPNGHPNFTIEIRTGNSTGDGDNSTHRSPVDPSGAESTQTAMSGSPTTGNYFVHNFNLNGSGKSGRYISVNVVNLSGANLKPTTDVKVTITALRLYRKTTYVSSHVSTLNPCDVVNDVCAQSPSVNGALTTGNPRGFITADTGYVLPSYETGNWITFHDAISAATAYEGYVWFVDKNQNLHWKPWDSNPSYVTNLSQGSRLTAAGDDFTQLFNRVIVTGAGDNGNPVTVHVHHDNPRWGNDAPTPSNAGFETNVANWTVLNGVFAQSATFAKAGSNSGRISTGASGLFDVYTDQFTATAHKKTPQFIEGDLYKVTLWVRCAAACTALSVSVLDNFGINSLSNDEDTDSNSTGDALSASGLTAAKAGFIKVERQFTADWNGTLQVHVSGTGTISSIVAYIDAMEVTRHKTGHLGAQDIQRTALLNIANPITKADAKQIGKAFIKDHGPWPPFRGTLTVPAGALLDAQTNQPVPLYVPQIGEAILIGDVMNPAQGTYGRVGKIVGTSYDHEAQELQISIDNSRDWVFHLKRRLRRKVLGTDGSNIQT